MPCAICGSTETTLVVGVYYCAECGTQTEETRVEVSDAEETFSWRSSLSSSTADRKSKDKRIFYAPWITVEAYNLILFEQVSALIKLGASKSLMDTVLHIWALYLQKCEIAFRKDYNADEETPRLGPFPRRRDVKILYGDQVASLKKKRYKGKPVKKKTSTPSKKFMKEDSEVDSSTLKDSLTEGFSTDISDDESGKGKKKVKYSVHVRKIQKLKGKKPLLSKNGCMRERCVSQMTLSKSLCFCYLGLIYSKDQLLLSDLIRFVNEGRIPYYNAVDCLPSYMKLQCGDVSSLSTHSTPDLCKLSIMCAKLIKFLDLPNFKNRSLLPLVCRFVKDLNLPNDLIPIVKTLLVKSKSDDEVYEKNTWRNDKCLSLPVYEHRALAFIAVALKMLFVLDGNFEKEHSEIMVKANALNTGEYFIWEKWQKQLSIKEYLFLPNTIYFPKMLSIHCLSAQQVIDNYPYTKLKPFTSHIAGYPKTLFNSKTEMKNILSSIVHINEENMLLPPSSFPLRSLTKHFVTQWKNMLAYKENTSLSLDNLIADFSNASLAFDPESLSSKDYLKRLLFSSLYESVDVVSVGYSSAKCEKVLRTSSKYWFKNHSQYKKLDCHNELPGTFYWLLSFLSRYIGTDISTLYLEIIWIEKKLFLQKLHFHNKSF